MDKLIREEVLAIKELPLSTDDLKNLKWILSARVRKMIIPYLGCLSALIYIGVVGYESLGQRRYGRYLTKAEAVRFFDKVSPWLIAFCLLLLIVILVIDYFKSIQPVRKDIKKGTKMILSLKPEKRDPFLNRYFIYAPLQKKRQLELSAENYYQLKDGDVKLEVAPTSLLILSLLNGEEKIQFFQHKKD